MDNFIVLYNPLAGNGTVRDKMRELESLMQGDSLYFSNMLDIRDYGAFFNDMPDGASIIICGGDGTLNRFLNDTEDIRPRLRYLLLPQRQRQRLCPRYRRGAQ